MRRPYGANVKAECDGIGIKTDPRGTIIMANTLEQSADVVAKPTSQDIHQGLQEIYGEMKKWSYEQPKCKNADLPCVELMDGDEVVKDGTSPGRGVSKYEDSVVKTKGESQPGEPKNFAPDTTSQPIAPGNSALPKEGNRESDKEEIARKMFQQTLDALRGKAPDEAVTASTELNQKLEEKLSGSGYFVTGNSWGELTLKRNLDEHAIQSEVIAIGKVSD
jgi:hypothetical protein